MKKRNFIILLIFFNVCSLFGCTILKSSEYVQVIDFSKVDWIRIDDNFSYYIDPNVQVDDDNILTTFQLGVLEDNKFIAYPKEAQEKAVVIERVGILSVDKLLKKYSSKVVYLKSNIEFLYIRETDVLKNIYVNCLGLKESKVIELQKKLKDDTLVDEVTFDPIDKYILRIKVKKEYQNQVEILDQKCSYLALKYDLKNVYHMYHKPKTQSYTITKIK